MRRAIDDQEMYLNSRLAATVLAQLRLRFDENWRAVIDQTLGVQLNSIHRDIILAVMAISGARLLASPEDGSGKDFANPFPGSSVSRCNVSSIAAATAIKRETVRRYVLRLKSLGIIDEESTLGLQISLAFGGREEVRALARQQVDAFAKAAAQLRSLGIVTNR